MLVSCCFDFFCVQLDGDIVLVFWGDRTLVFFGGSNSDDQLVPSVEMLGRVTLTFGWWVVLVFL